MIIYAAKLNLLGDLNKKKHGKFTSRHNISIQLNDFSIVNEKSTILACNWHAFKFCPSGKNSSGEFFLSVIEGT